MLKLAEELLLLAYDENGNMLCQSISLNYALTGALLIELNLLRKVSLEQNYLVLVNNTLTGDDILDKVVSIIEKSAHPINIQQLINMFQSQIENIRVRLLAQLIDKGISAVKLERFLWIFKPLRYPSVDTSYKQAIINRIRIAALEAETVPLRTAILINLIGYCHLVYQLVNSIFTPSERKEAQQKIKLIQQENVINKEVVDIMSSIQAAITVAVFGLIDTNSTSSLYSTTSATSNQS